MTKKHQKQGYLSILLVSIVLIKSIYSRPDSQFLTNIEKAKIEDEENKANHNFHLFKKFLQSISEDQSKFINTITKNYNGKCSEHDDVYTCIVSSNVELNKSFTELQSKFTLEKKSYQNIFYGYDNEDIPADVYPCLFFLYKFYIRKIEDKIMVLNDSTCRSNFSNCPIHEEEECDYKDCLELIKLIYKNRVNVDLLNNYKELKPSPQAISKYTSIVEELKKLQGLLLNEIYVSTCTTFTNAQCMNLFTNGNDIVEPTRAQIENVLKSCNK